MPPAMIGDSGVIIEGKNIGIYLDSNNPPPGKPNGWRGIHIGNAAVHLPCGLSGKIGTLSMTNCYIGNGGFSGIVSDMRTPALSATIFGIQCSLESVAIEFVQNSLSAASIEGTLMLPFFDEPLDVDIGLSLNGNFSVKLRDPSGILMLTKPKILSVTVEGLGFDIVDGIFSVHLTGDMKPLFPGLDWPTFHIKDLSIDSKGNVHLDGGWLDLKEQYSLDFYNFKIEVTKIGFGKTDDGGKWIGISGGLKLIDGLSAGASVEGLRVIWYDDGITPTKITLNGVGVEFEVPDVLRFKGSVSYNELKGPTGDTIHRFDGDIKLELISLDLQIDAKVVVGTDKDPQNNTFTFFAIYLDIEPPAGIPLWATGVALYGMAGLFALKMEPNKKANEEWYESQDGLTPGWYKREPIGITDLKTKWDAKRSSLALGGGITLGTLPDNGFTVSAKVLLVIVFPGPIILIEGKANLLKERAKLDSEPIFRALAVLDEREGRVELFYFLSS
jgi:hypothetical protein